MIVIREQMCNFNFLIITYRYFKRTLVIFNNKIVQLFTTNTINELQTGKFGI